MPSSDPTAAIVAGFRHAWEAGRLAHAYLIVGTPRGSGGRLAEAVVRTLLCAGADRPCGACAACRRVAARTHPDAVWIEPESKGRLIPIETIHERLLGRLLQTSFEGGWKAAVLLWAERVREDAANALLKTLEEPPARTVLILVSDQPEFLLPTIVSRCHRVTLPFDPPALEEAWRERVLDIVSSAGADGGVLAGHAASANLCRVLDEVKAAAEEEVGKTAEPETDGDVIDARANARYRGTRAEILRLIAAWQRDVLLAALGRPDADLSFPARAAAARAQAAGLTFAAAAARLDRVQAMHRQFELSLSPEQVVAAFFLGG
jgi:DNA polymerase-3 subunit delta'